MDKISPDNAREVMSFPCEFTIKIFGLASDEFEVTVLTILRKYVSNLNENAIQTRPSKDKKYTALSITFTAENREQLDNIYREMTSNPLILMVL